MFNRTRMAAFLESDRVSSLIIGVIIVNAITLGLETSQVAMEAAGPLIIAIDRLCLTIFVIEILAKLFAYRFAFFRNGWNIFDFVIVGESCGCCASSRSRRACAAWSRGL